MLVAVTGYGETAARERARRVGFTHHLTKPADPGVLADIIGQVSASQSVS